MILAFYLFKSDGCHMLRSQLHAPVFEQFHYMYVNRQHTPAPRIEPAKNIFISSYGSFDLFNKSYEILFAFLIFMIIRHPSF